MRIILESTDHFVEIDGLITRVWRGVSESTGTEIVAFVARIAVPAKEATAELRLELIELSGTGVPTECGEA